MELFRIRGAALYVNSNQTKPVEQEILTVKLLQEKKMFMTGTYGVRFLRVPPVEIEDDYRITSRYLRRDGRKLFTMSALIDSKGTIYAMGDSVAIIFNLPG